MQLPLNLVTDGCKDFLQLDDVALKRLEKYAKLLVEWNEKINLTAILDPEGIAVKHFLDCLMIFKYVDIPLGASVIDIGTGAGFPGVVMKIARPDIKLTLMDSLAKRITFLENLCGELELDVTTIHSRAEDITPTQREGYDFAVARAVANMRVLTEYCLPFVKVGGSFIAMKGASAEEETLEATKAISVLGGTLTKKDMFNLGELGVRGIINVKKISQTSTKYPRNPGKISKQPL
ncbi:MAG: 16S rRNA (guanine(527)-N(7))-methyltransferase RsmG [Clostridia bacterium]|nr:16S rRNA (guanine(527)-N(7))-methyltransferase RsmG [Clostridia bacterium]